jgi:hypothetical protein
VRPSNGGCGNKFRQARRDAIAAPAAEMAGTDLDSELESAAIEHFVTGGKASK